MSRIHQLDAGVVNKIAAGEVVERPASVVKELLENSIDALATHVEVDVAQGGTELIRVVDDGEGIHPDDILLTISSHATSKIASSDDLFSVRTMGFRGEALASIAEVSRFRIRSRQPDLLEGIELEVDCGELRPPQPCGCPAGTLVEIRQLFANTPVRRKFLKTVATEFSHISEQFTRIALAHPRLHMVLRHNDKPVFELPGTLRLIDRLSTFYGRELTEHLIEVSSESGDVRMWGYVGHPSQSKSTRKSQHFFLNGRWIQDRTLQHALSEAYRGLVMVGRQPVCFLFLEMPPNMVDVNVHPTKVEVRFRDSQQLYRQLLSMLRGKFLGMDLGSELRVAAGGHGMPSTADPERQRELQAELSSWARMQLGQQRAGDTPASADGLENGGFFIRPADLLPSPWAFPAAGHEQAATGGAFPPGFDGAAPEDPEAAGFHAAFQGGQIPSGDVAGNRGRPSVSRIAGDARAMQVHDCYLVVETPDGVTVIDQHALHERILYEHLRARVLAGSVESQRLLVPETIELTPQEVSVLVENAELLGQFGFGVEEFGGNTILLNRYPVMLPRTNVVQLTRDLAEKLAGSAARLTRRDLLDDLLHMISCKAAIKAGHRLSPEEMEALLAQRHLVDDAHHCPHGRPTALVLSRAELDRQFGRLG